MRIDRMLAIIVLMLNKNRITARELADKFEVSVRTIYRDLEAVNMSGIPLISYSGNNGGFGIMENYKIDRQILTFNDMLSILSALKGLNTTLENKELDTAINKISSLVPKDKTEHLKMHLEQIVIDILPWGYRKTEKENFKLIHQATINNKLLQFIYQNSRGEKIQRKVEPMTLLFKGYAWYLFAYCLVRKDFRIFRFSRMKKLKILEQTFIRRDRTYQEFMEPENSNMKMVKVTLKFSPGIRNKVEEYFYEDQITLEKDGHSIVKISLPDDDWLYSMILNYGENVEVLEPASIRRGIHEKAKLIMQKNDSTSNI